MFVPTGPNSSRTAARISRIDRARSLAVEEKGGTLKISLATIEMPNLPKIET